MSSFVNRASSVLYSKMIYLTLDGLVEEYDTNFPYTVMDDNRQFKKNITYPTLDMIRVPDHLQGMGIGMKLLNRLRLYMKKRRIPYVVFLNYNKPFWDSVHSKSPGTIEFRKNKKYGIYKLDPTTDTSQVYI